MIQFHFITQNVQRLPSIGDSPERLVATEHTGQAVDDAQPLAAEQSHAAIRIEWQCFPLPSDFPARLAKIYAVLIQYDEERQRREGGQHGSPS